MASPPDWHKVEEVLFDQGKAAIMQFASEHSHEQCSFFACYADPFEGLFEYCFDTFNNAIRMAMKTESEAIEYKNMMLRRDWLWKQAKILTNHPHIVDYAPFTGLFAYTPYTEITFDGWLGFVDSEDYPEKKDGEDDYLEGNTRMIIWRVFDRFIENHLFQHLHMTSPFRLGYQFHDSDLIVLRILNWPQLSSEVNPIN